MGVRPPPGTKQNKELRMNFASQNGEAKIVWLLLVPRVFPVRTTPQRRSTSADSGQRCKRALPHQCYGIGESHFD